MRLKLIRLRIRNDIEYVGSYGYHDRYPQVFSTKQAIHAINCMHQTGERCPLIITFKEKRVKAVQCNYMLTGSPHGSQALLQDCTNLERPNRRVKQLPSRSGERAGW